MLVSTQGIVLHTSPYSESSVITKMFTRELGTRSYIIKGVRGGHGKVKQNMLQPLSLLDLVVYHNHKSNLNYIKEMNLVPYPNAQISNAQINAIAFFANEVIYKVLKEDESNILFFDYLASLIEQMHKTDCNYSQLPIEFLLRTSQCMGIGPMDNYNTQNKLFDLQEGRFVSQHTDTTLSAPLSLMLNDYLNPNTAHPPIYPLQQRQQLIDALLTYFHLHYDSFRNFTSHYILHSVLA